MACGARGAGASHTAVLPASASRRRPGARRARRRPQHPLAWYLARRPVATQFHLASSIVCEAQQRATRLSGIPQGLRLRGKHGKTPTTLRHTTAFQSHPNTICDINQHVCRKEPVTRGLLPCLPGELTAAALPCLHTRVYGTHGSEHGLIYLNRRLKYFYLSFAPYQPVVVTRVHCGRSVVPPEPV